VTSRWLCSGRGAFLVMGVHAVCICVWVLVDAPDFVLNGPSPPA
jgi:hypothetical protein